jgi:hypothetical protein
VLTAFSALALEVKSTVVGVKDDVVVVEDKVTDIAAGVTELRQRQKGDIVASHFRCFPVANGTFRPGEARNY